jgi:5-methyltetrahydropteroyltriglutamate--homocysteine methyltransferase
MARRLEATLSGIFPRSDALVEATRGLDRRRVTPEHCEAVRAADTQAVVEAQRAAGFAAVTDGQLSWQDLFRPFVEASGGLAAGALTRWFDNNTFYRKPVVKGELTLHKGLSPEYLRTRVVEGSPWKVVLPGPYTFARAAEGPGDKANRIDRIGEFGALLRRATRWCTDRGARQVQFSEPWMVWEPLGRQEMRATEEAYETVTKGLRAQTLLFPYFGDLKRVFPDVLDFPVDAVGIDLTATDLEDLEEHAFDKGAVLGAVDGRNSLVETPEELVLVVGRALETLDPDWVAIAPSCELELTPRAVAQEKVKVLGRAVELGRDLA